MNELDEDNDATLHLRTNPVVLSNLSLEADCSAVTTAKAIMGDERP